MSRSKRDPFKVGDWVRLSDKCTSHPDNRNSRSRQIPPREFIGVYLGNYRVEWMSGMLPEQNNPHWGFAGCLELVTRGPRKVSDAV